MYANLKKTEALRQLVKSAIDCFVLEKHAHRAIYNLSPKAYLSLTIKEINTLTSVTINLCKYNFFMKNSDRHNIDTRYKKGLTPLGLPLKYLKTNED